MRRSAIIVPADDAGRDLRAFVGFGPATDPITAVIAFDAGGGQLEMLELHPGPRPDRDGPMPTPAGKLLILARDELGRAEMTAPNAP